MYPTCAGSIGCTMLMLWPHKYKVGHIDLILIYHQNLLHSSEIPEYSYVSHFHNIPIILTLTNSFTLHSSYSSITSTSFTNQRCQMIQLKLYYYLLQHKWITPHFYNRSQSTVPFYFSGKGILTSKFILII